MDNSILLERMLGSEEPELTLKWVREVKQGILPFDPSFNSLLLGEIASDNSRRLKSLDWARVSVEIYEWSDWKVALGWNVDGYISQAMSARMQMIFHFGSDPGSDILDPVKISELFCLYASISREEALLIAQKYREAEETRVNRRTARLAALEVKRLCVRLDLLHTFKERGLPVSQEAEHWLSIKKALCESMN